MTSTSSDIIIAGIGQTPVGEFWDISLRSLAAEAILAAIQDAHGLKPEIFYIANVLAAPASNQANLGALLPENVGMTGVEGVTVEAADASGGAAFRMAYTAVLSGAVDSALAIGVEKYTDVIGSRSDSTLAHMLDADFEAPQGLTPLSLSALLMQRYLHEYQVERGAFAGFPEVAHANAASNPKALFPKALREGAYQKARPIDECFNLFDVAPYADGAAAVLITKENRLPKDWDKPRVKITGSSLLVDSLAIHDRPAPLVWDAARLSIERACRQAGIMPKDIDFFEYHDATTLHAALSLEAAGFASEGQGWRMAKPEIIGLNGQIPVATFGGLKARGHPLGATGLYQAVEATRQLRGEAGENQVSDAHIGLIQSLGGPASTAAAHILCL